MRKESFSANSGFYFLQFIYAERLRFVCEKCLGKAPDGFKQLRITVLVQRFLAFPMAVGHKNIFIRMILPKLQMTAAGKVSDRMLVGFEVFQKCRHRLRLEGHTYDPDQHSLSFQSLYKRHCLSSARGDRLRARYEGRFPANPCC